MRIQVQLRPWQPDSKKRKPSPRVSAGGRLVEVQKTIFENQYTGIARLTRGTVISDDRSDQPGVVLSARYPRDRSPDHYGSNSRKSRSAFPAGPHDGPHESTCRHDAPGPQRLPTQNQHAQVQSSWTSVHSSTKTPHEQKRDLRRQVNALPFRWTARNPNSARRRHPGVHPVHHCRGTATAEHDRPQIRYRIRPALPSLRERPDRMGSRFDPVRLMREVPISSDAELARVNLNHKLTHTISKRSRIKPMGCLRPDSQLVGLSSTLAPQAKSNNPTDRRLEKNRLCASFIRRLRA